MKLNWTEPKWLFTLILAFHITSVHVEVSNDDADVRILIVGMRGDSRFSAADILSGWKAGGQEDREIVKTPVMTDEGRRMMQVTGPNLCEDDTATQSFTTALFLSSPGPHAVLILLEDQESEECDVVKRVQERLGADVLQYCIVLLHQNHQERLTGASREMINACGGRFHMIRDSDPKPAQTAALVAEIHKLVWLNAGSFFSALNETQQRLETEKLELLKRLKEIGGKLEENQVVSAVPDALGVVGCSLIISLIVVVLATDKNVKMLIFQATVAGLVTFMASIRNALGPHVAFALNLALCSTVAAIFIRYLPMRKLDNIKEKYSEFSYTVSLGVTLGSVASVRSFSDVFIACFASIGVAFGTFAFLKLSFELKTMNVRELFLLFLFCAVGAELTMLCVIVIAAVFGNITVILIIINIVIVSYTSNMQNIEFLPWLMVFACCCVLIGSVVLTLDMLLYFLKGCIEYLLGSFLFYPALLLGTLMMMGHLSPPTK
ncbi:uncharacterized protein LOC120460353 isoform X2 [Pimephales promelas]|uniref:uncharacterized protein LOC120460353 isoform X2 n=1 Tax=Pimephales promelas TaxID=90988 RepID=UPI001955B426|nr:uncharacterized protein LOC120460353 isoform X2 [Pimephales promelas]XP_039504028.1 uncharacterized protein LOC120460353 isoform X2 [Pimephales promelas]